MAELRCCHRVRIFCLREDEFWPPVSSWKMKHRSMQMSSILNEQDSSRGSTEQAVVTRPYGTVQYPQVHIDTGASRSPEPRRQSVERTAASAALGTCGTGLEAQLAGEHEIWLSHGHMAGSKVCRALRAPLCEYLGFLTLKPRIKGGSKVCRALRAPLCEGRSEGNPRAGLRQAAQRHHRRRRKAAARVPRPARRPGQRRILALVCRLLPRLLCAVLWLRAPHGCFQHLCHMGEELQISDHGLRS